MRATFTGIPIGLLALVSLTVAAPSWTQQPSKQSSSPKPAAKAQPPKKAAAKSSAPAPKASSGSTSSKKTTASKASPRRKTTARTKRRAPAPRRAPAGQRVPAADRYQEIQRALADRGYLGGPADGNWGADSVAALKRFQEDQQLTAHGKIDALSLIALGLGPKRGNGNTSAAIAPP